MLRYLPFLVVIGLVFYIVFAAVDKLILRKIRDPKKRKYAKIAIYVVLYFCMAVVCDEVVMRLR